MVYSADDIDRINASFVPSPEQKIARYLGFENFKKMIDGKALWLSNSKEFTDKCEGEIPFSFFQKWEKESVDNYYTIHKMLSNVYQAFITCWFEFELESETMWLSYGGEKNENNRNSKGVCIITDVSKLAAYTDCLDAKIFKVKYINYEKHNYIQPPFYFGKKDNLEAPIFNGRVFFAYKQIEYRDEREIRAITYKKSLNNGLCAKIEPANFIEKIIINPHATDEENKEIMNYLIANNLSNKITNSSIKCRR